MANDNLTITTADGVRLGATHFQPDHSNGRVVLINSAMGVKRGYYQKFAAYLMAQGFTVITYDYRSIGDSLDGTLKNSPAQLWEWGVKDLPALIDWIKERYPNDKLLVVGHSVGGQIIGLTPHHRHIDAALFVACQSGYWNNWEGLLKLRMIGVWYVMIPLLTRLYGYFPSQKVGMGEDLPNGIAQEWARGGRQPHYLRDIYPQHDHYAEFKAPIRSISISDDWYAPRSTCQALLGFYHQAKSEHLHLRPSDIGVKSIGHFGFFREKFADSLWQQTAEWLCTK